jgi:hypothetical protein
MLEHAERDPTADRRMQFFVAQKVAAEVRAGLKIAVTLQSAEIPAPSNQAIDIVTTSDNGSNLF